jgi:hypothetical protein
MKGEGLNCSSVTPYERKQWPYISKMILNGPAYLNFKYETYSVLSNVAVE